MMEKRKLRRSKKHLNYNNLTLEKKIKKIFVRQQDRSDCGVACLASVIKYHGGAATLEKLRELSGTNKQGTTLLGLFQAAKQTGLLPGAFEADITHLKKITSPCILHVIVNDRLQHYVVFFAFADEKFVIG